MLLHCTWASPASQDSLSADIRSEAVAGEAPVGILRGEIFFCSFFFDSRLLEEEHVYMYKGVSKHHR